MASHGPDIIYSIKFTALNSRCRAELVGAAFLIVGVAGSGVMQNPATDEEFARGQKSL